MRDRVPPAQVNKILNQNVRSSCVLTLLSNFSFFHLTIPPTAHLSTGSIDQRSQPHSRSNNHHPSSLHTPRLYSNNIRHVLCSSPTTDCSKPELERDVHLPRWVRTRYRPRAPHCHWNRLFAQFGGRHLVSQGHPVNAVCATHSTREGKGGQPGDQTQCDRYRVFPLSITRSRANMRSSTRGRSTPRCCGSIRATNISSQQTVNIYWFTSTLFGLIEAGIFTAIEHLRAPAYWGRSSPLLKLSPAALRRRGIDLSTKTPLERAGMAYTLEMNKTLKKQPLSLERGARAVFIKGFQTAQFFKRVSHIIASLPASTRRVFLDLPLYRRKVVAWLARMTLHYRKYWIPRWNRLQKMRFRDYWMWSGRKRAAIRDWREQRWRTVASRFTTRFRKAELREKIAKGEVKPPTKAPKWMTKAQRKEALKEKMRIR
jgi:hypothetical protein